jgi:hypothetical protein
LESPASYGAAWSDPRAAQISGKTLERLAYVWDSPTIIYGVTLENLHLQL